MCVWNNIKSTAWKRTEGNFYLSKICDIAWGKNVGHYVKIQVWVSSTVSVAGN